MKNHFLLSFALLIAAPLGAPAREPLDLKPIPLTEFMQNVDKQGGSMKDEASQSFYNPLTDIVQNLRTH